MAISIADMKLEPERTPNLAAGGRFKLASGFLTLTAIFTLAACGASAESASESDADQAAQEAITADPATSAESPTPTTTEAATPDTQAPDNHASDGQAPDGEHSGGDMNEGHEPATQAAILFPIADGELLNWQTALADLIGPNYDQYEASRARFGLTQQTTVSQETPMGNFALIYMEGADLGETSKQMATSPDAWDVDWRQMTSGLHGADFNDEQALSFASKLVLNTGDLDDEAKKSTTPFLFFMPLAQPSAGALLNELESLSPEKLEQHRNARSNIGVLEEKIFLQETAVGPGLVIYWESLDPAASLDQLLSSEESYDIWLQENFASYHALPIDQIEGIWRQNALMADFPARD